MTLAEAVQKHLPPLVKHTRPGLAAIIGVLFGGVGLAIYFRSLPDLLPLEVVGALVIVGSAIAGVPLLDVLSVVAMPAAIFGGSYGYWRADSSNRRRMAPRVAGGLVGSEG
jgi:hypothetical protein